MGDVAKEASGTSQVNPMVLHRIKVLFQRFPGTAGTDAERGISGVDYDFLVDGAVVSRGKTAADGGVTLDVPVGADVVLEIFNTQYYVRIVNRLEPMDKLDMNRTKGEQRRLQLLGYELGEVDGRPQGKSDNAQLNFQADNGINHDEGNITAELKREFGE